MPYVAQLIVVLIAALAAVIAYGGFGWLGAALAFPITLAIVGWLADYQEILE